MEETFEIDLTKDRVWLHDYSGYNVHPPDEVIRRARLRIGETKFAVFSNRSSHFCFWAKVNETPVDDDENIIQTNRSQFQYEGPFSQNRDLQLRQIVIDHRRGKLISTNIYEKRSVRIHEEIKPGDLIEFKFHYDLFHKAICTKVNSTGCDYKVNITFVHYGSSYTVVEETRSFNLNRENISIYLYHPLHKYARADIITRARAKVNELKYCIVDRRSSHFTDGIATRGQDFVITSLEDVHQGDVIIYSYWGLWHEAVVIKVNEGIFEIVHYGLRSFLATREIIKEEIKIDLTKQVIKKKRFKGYYTYTSKVTVKRAMSRIGEQRFSYFGNRSFEFVHWCKVVQEPSVYSLKSVVNGKDDNKTIMKVVIIPHAGQVHTESFHKNWIKTWEELTIGSILYLRGKYGILVSLDEKSNTIELSCYREKQVEQYRFQVDLKKNKENIWVFWCNPRKCHTPEEIIDRALKRDRYKIPNSATDWEFCKGCVINEHSPY